MKLREEPGYLGAFTRAQALGAIPNGRRVMKATMEEGDGHQIGALGTVLGSIANPGLAPMPGKPPVVFCYFVEFDRSPHIPVFVVDYKIAPAQ